MSDETQLSAVQEEILDFCRFHDLAILGPTDLRVAEGIVVRHRINSPKLKVLSERYALCPSGPHHTIVEKK